jgi:hypothetical protein
MRRSLAIPAAGSTCRRPSPAPAPRQYLALVTKHLTLLSRQRGLCLCQLLTPLIILGLLLVLENIVATEVGLVSVFIIPPIYLPLNVYPDPSTSLGAGAHAAAAAAPAAASAGDFVRLLSVFSHPPQRLVRPLQLRERRGVAAAAAAPAAASRRQRRGRRRGRER